MLVSHLNQDEPHYYGRTPLPIARCHPCLPLAAQVEQTAESINLKGIPLPTPDATLYSNPESPAASVGTVTVCGTYSNTTENGIEFGNAAASYYQDFDYENRKNKKAPYPTAGEMNTAWIYLPSLFESLDNPKSRSIPMAGNYIKITVKQPCKVYVTTSVDEMSSLIVMEDDRILYNRKLHSQQS